MSDLPGLDLTALRRYLDEAAPSLLPGELSAELIAAQQDIADNLLRLQLIPRAVSVADAHWHFKLAG